MGHKYVCGLPDVLAGALHAGIDVLKRSLKHSCQRTSSLRKRHYFLKNTAQPPAAPRASTAKPQSAQSKAP